MVGGWGIFNYFDCKDLEGFMLDFVLLQLCSWKLFMCEFLFFMLVSVNGNHFSGKHDVELNANAGLRLADNFPCVIDERHCTKEKSQE